MSRRRRSIHAHTPGPWEAPYIDDESNSRQWWIRTTSGVVASCDPEGKSDAETTANARIIAAAPAMLEALKACACTCLEADGDGDAVTCDRCAAIELATGRRP